MRQIHISLPQSAIHYTVDIGAGILAESLQGCLSTYDQTIVFIVTSETVADLYLNRLLQALPGAIQAETIILPDGETHKHLQTVSRIIDFLAEKRANRRSILLAFGGGVVGDMAGFASAVYMRGIRCIQIPTTLLSQVDSGIGGKTGVNHSSGKNMIGAFKQPLKTIIDIDWLDTLPPREFVAGYAELIKHGLIKDAHLFDLLDAVSLKELQQDRERLSEAIHLSCQVKAGVVEEDEKESGWRAVLNFGHTLGHFLETITGYTTLLHGEAVVIGMDFAAWWSYHRQGDLEKTAFETIRGHLSTLGISLQWDGVQRNRFIDIISHDKKSAAEGIRFVGLSAIGEATLHEQISAESLWDAFQAYLAETPFFIS